MVGDTEADIITAKNHGVKVMAVLSGIRDRTQLELSQPDLIVKDLSEAVDLVLNSSLPRNESLVL
jgi:phosphoglycolate phosphatase-like HAD superfamily hydrolase